MTTKKITVSFMSLFALMAVLALTGCGDSGAARTASAPASGGKTMMSQTVGVCDTAKGASLYAAKCASCHGALDSSTKRGATYQRIKSAIANYSAMQSIQMTDDEIYDVAAALGAPCEKPAGTGTTCDTANGASQYAAKCASCHGALENSAKKGATYKRIKDAITNYPSMQSIQMTDQEILDVAAALGAACSTEDTPAPVEGKPAGVSGLLWNIFSNTPLAGLVGGEAKGISPVDVAPTLAKLTNRTVGTCTTNNCHPGYKGKEHHFGIAPQSDTDCWVCHTKHVACATCHDLGRISIGAIGQGYVTWLGIPMDVKTPTDKIVYGTPLNSTAIVSHVGLLAKEAPIDLSAVTGDFISLANEGKLKHTGALLGRVDNILTDVGRGIFIKPQNGLLGTRIDNIPVLGNLLMSVGVPGTVKPPSEERVDITRFPGEEQGSVNE